MRKVLIVDDERWIRRGLIQSIPWEAYGLELAGEAEDGEDGYRMALELKPDLLFLDMRMPGLDGKQLIGMLGRDLPDLLTIVVSGYSDFEYTKEAIRHKAFDYLLKPVKKEELAALLDKAEAELRRRDAERRRSSSERAGSWLRGALVRHEGGAGPDTDGFGDLPDSWRSGCLAVWVGRADRQAGGAGGPAQLLDAMEEQLRQSHPFYFGGRWEFAVTASPEGHGELVAAICADRLPRAELSRLLAEVQSLLKRPAGVGVSFGVSLSAGGARELREGFRQAGLALAGRPLGAGCAVRFAGDAAAEPPAYPREQEAALLLALQLGQRAAALREFDKLYAQLCGAGATADSFRRGAALLVHSLEKQLQASGTGLAELCGSHPLALTERFAGSGDAESVRETFLTGILPAVLAAYDRQGENQGEQIVRDVQKLIRFHYDQPLSLQQIAESRYLNPDYLSRLFKKKTGCNFVDYVTDVRINKSIELMRVPKYKNYEIAQMVGYEDYRYFSQIFKKKTGKTIGEYRASVGLADR